MERLMNDPEFLAEVDKVNEKLNEELAKARKRILMLADKAIDIIEDELNKPPHPMGAGKKVDTAFDLLKMANVPVKDQEKVREPLVIRLVKDEKEEIVEKKKKEE